MLIYMASHTAYHCIIAGYCKKEGKFYKRDPGMKTIVYEDFLLNNRITEYLLFESV